MAALVMRIMWATMTRVRVIAGKAARINVFEKWRGVAHGRQRIEPAILDGEEEHQDIGDEEFGRGNGRERDRIDDAVEPAVTVERRQDAEKQRQRHGERSPS